MDINTFLKQIEIYLVDLKISDRSRILSELSTELKDKDLYQLDAKSTANSKRVELGLPVYIEKPKSSIISLIIKSFVVLTIVFIIFIFFLIEKFTPLFEVNEKSGKVTILGGLIDIDAESGMFKVGDQIQFADANYTNAFAANIPMSPDMKIIFFKINTGLYTFKTSENAELKLDCKLSTPPDPNIIKTNQTEININLEEIQGSCEISIPKNKTLNFNANTASFKLIGPEFHSIININSGTIEISPLENLDYDYKLKLENGHIDRFEQTGTNSGYKIHANLKNGSINQQY